MTRRVSVVTGATGGIGAAVVSHLRRLGWWVIATDRQPDSESSADAPIDRNGAFVCADLGVADGRASLVEHVRRDHHRLDGLVNVAGLASDRALVDTDDASWTATFDVNVTAPFVLMRDLYPLLREARGAVVNISSVHAVATSRNAAAYAASKAALVGLTKAAALEFGADGVRVNAVLPGAVDTPMLAAGLARSPHPDGLTGAQRDLTARTPLGFIAGPDHLAPAVAYLLDAEQSGYVTGHSLVVDGGALTRLGTE